MLGALELEDPPRQLRPNRRADYDVAVSGTVLRPQGAPRGVEPLTAHRVKRRRKVQAAEQLEESLALDHLQSHDVARHGCVLDALAWGESHALLTERERHAEKLEVLGGGLLLARLESELVHGRLKHLKVHHRPPHLHAVAHHWRAVAIEDEVVDGDDSAVIYVHAQGEEGRPALGDLVVGAAERFSASRSALEPLEHALVSRWVSLVEFSKCLPRAVHEEVGEPRALRRVGGAAKTAALVDDESVGSDRAVAVKLARLPPELLVVGDGVGRRRLHRRPGGL